VIAKREADLVALRTRLERGSNVAVVFNHQQLRALEELAGRSPDEGVLS
jgi:hypothetical protein